MEKNEVAVISAVENQKSVTYKSAGQEVTLSRTIVRNYLTKGASNVDDADIVQFISICQFNQLNPFLNEAYLIKYGNQPAQMVVSKEALLKRADACETYEGMQAGIIVLRGKDVMEVEGCFLAPGDMLLGGYDKKQSLWKEKPSTMISKIAKVQALREAFPAQLGAMYTQEEQSTMDYQEQVDEEIRTKGNKKAISIPAQDATEAPVEISQAPEQPAPAENAAPAGPGF